MARDRLHLMELGINKKMVYALSGREANELLNALLMLKKLNSERTPETMVVEA